MAPEDLFYYSLLSSLGVEEWADIPGYEKSYQASNLGRVRSLDRSNINSRGMARHLKGKDLVKVLDKDKYECVTLSKNNHRQKTHVHKLVALTFLGPRPEGKQVAHFDDVKLNNSLFNLRYATPKSNHSDRVRNGLSNRGEKHPNRKLDEASVVEIKHLIKEGKRSLAEIGRMFDVTTECIFGIKKGRSWSWLEI